MFEAVGLNGRVYQRRFDYDDAKARYQGGESIRALAAEYGVSWSTVQRVVVPGRRERMDFVTREYNLAVCDICRGPCLRVTHPARNVHDGRQLCATCRAKETRTGVALTADGALVEVYCASCKRWLDPDCFGRGTRYPDLREGGFHGSCRSCLTRQRQDYRERHKIPCVRCGAPCLPASEKGLRGKDTGLCRSCYRARKSAAAQRLTAT